MKAKSKHYWDVMTKWPFNKLLLYLNTPRTLPNFYGVAFLGTNILAAIERWPDATLDPPPAPRFTLCIHCIPF